MWLFKKKEYSSDEELLKHYKQSGNKDLFADLFKKHVSVVYGTCLFYLQDKDAKSQKILVYFNQQNDKPEGFIVLQPVGNALHIWATWSRIFDYDIFTKGLEEVKAIARQGGKTRVTFSSQRKGWERRAKLMGFKPQTWEFIL